jgi:hypothetical protein
VSEGASGGGSEVAAHRLGAFAAAVGVLALVALGANAVASLSSDGLPNPVVRLAAGGCLVLLSGGLVALWRTGAAPAQLLKTGLAYQVLGALFLALPEYSGEYFLDPELRRLVWLGAWIVVLPLVVPAHPVKHLVVSSLCATFPVLLYWAWLSSEDMFSADRGTLAKAFLPLYACALLSLGSAYFGWRRFRQPVNA